jgi:hypothetical protein
VPDFKVINPATDEVVGAFTETKNVFIATD